MREGGGGGDDLRGNGADGDVSSMTLVFFFLEKMDFSVDGRGVDDVAGDSGSAAARHP